MTMYYLTLQATPPPDESDIGGVYASCWISVDDASEAEAECRRALRSQGWTPLDLVDCFPVDRSKYVGTESLQHFDEAERDGACFVFYCYPPE
ncbi:hypothetical protein OAS39_11565 [Pirellulales bacterium]|nr:hypothetical protein [Pirellulales bacterium]MDC0936915.1 hypothetical protein [Pirellulales bacterium]